MPLTEEQLMRTLDGTDDALTMPASTAKPSTTEQQQPNNENTPPAIADIPPPVDPNKEPNTATPAATTFNLDEELVKITGGVVKTKDELAAILDRASKSTELETRIKTYEQENTSLRTKADANPFANDLTQKLDSLYRSGATEPQINAFLAINKVDIDALKPLEASSLALQVKFGLTPDEAKTYLADKYKIDLEDPNAIMDKNAEIALKIDSTTDRDFLKTHKAEVSQVPESQDAKNEALLQQQYTQQLTKMEPIAKSVVSDLVTNAFKGFSVNGKTDEGAIRMDLPVSDVSKAELEQAVLDMVASNWDRLTPDDKGKEAIRTFANNILILRNHEAQLIDVASKTEMRVRAEYNNATPIHRGNEGAPTGKTKSQVRQEGIMNTLREAEYID